MDETQRIFFRGAGEKMLAGHRELRAQLAQVRAALAGEDLPLTAQLRMRCLTYCQGLHHHHTMEDGAFPLIEKEVPELAPVLERLRQEHVKVAAALGRMQALLDGGGGGLGTATTRRELERAIAGLEEHFAYEEEHLLPALGVPRPARPS
jgi:hypothetical protein